MAYKMKGWSAGKGLPKTKGINIDPPPTRQDTLYAVMHQDPRNHDLIYSDKLPHDFRSKLEASSKKVGKLDQETINRINKEEESKGYLPKDRTPMKKNGAQDKKVPSIPTKEGSDAWRIKFLKDHGVTNEQVNNEIYRIAEESGVPGEDDVDLADWKKVVMNLSKKKPESPDPGAK